MNTHSRISSVLITKNEYTSNYETRFLAQRDDFQDKLSLGKNKRRSSRIVDQMGGRFRLETLVMYLSERVFDDPLLSSIFGAFSVDKLVLLLGDMMWYALDDSFETKKHYKSKILRKLCFLGLMDEPKYFDRMAMHLLDSMRVCSFRNTRSVTQLGDRFLQLRTALQAVAERIALRKTILPATIFVHFWNSISHCARKSNEGVVEISSS